MLHNSGRNLVNYGYPDRRDGVRSEEDRMRIETAVIVMTAMLAGSTAQSVLAQGYPSKPIRIIVAQAPGAQSDLFTRLLGQKLQESLGQPVVSDPRPGAG